MALVVADRVKETTTTTGTGTYTLAGAVDGFQSFAAIGDGNTCYYACTDGTDYEVGVGTFTLSGTTLARTAILESSNNDAAVNWGAGEKDIFVTLPASKAIFEDESNNVAVGNNITVGGTVDGVDIATRDAVLTSTTTTANEALPKAGGTMTGNIVMSGTQTVDGRDLSVDGAKLDNIEANATADQTAAEIEAIVNHDNLQGFVANEHIDWTASSAGTIHATNIPVVALTTVQTAANQAAHLALTAQEGDIVVRSDENKSYVHNGGTAGTMADYTELLTPTDAVLSVNGQTGAVTISNATTSSAGLMSSADKSKLDGVESGATADQTITAGAGLTGGGTGNVTISHADTSSQASVNGSGRTYIQDITLDTYGHVTGLATATETVTNTNQLTTFVVEDGDGTEVTISHGKEWKFREGGGIDINWTDTSTGSDADPYDLTFTHADTSSQGSVDNSNGTVIQDVTLDGYGHVTALGSVDLDGRYIRNDANDTGTGGYSTSGTYWEVGNGTGSVAINTNDGSGNANLTFNHNDGVPDISGNAARIEVNVDSSTNASMNFEILSGVTGGTSTSLSSILNLSESQVTAYKTLYENSNRVFTDGYHPNADTWTTARTLSLTGAVTGSASIDGSGNVSLATTATSDPTLTLSGDASGSATFTNLGNATLSVTVNDDSHNHSSSSGDFTVGGDLIATDVLPPTDSTGVVGNGTYTWSNGRFTNFQVDSTLTVRSYIDLADSDGIRFGSSDDSRFWYNGSTNKFQIEMESACLGHQWTNNGTEIAYLEKSTGNLTLTGTVDGRDIAADGAKLDGIDAGATAVPSGVIVMWSGAISAIPSGWVLCNGANGTPDLRARFVIGAQADSGQTYDVGDTGGATNVTLATGNLPSHTHGTGNYAVGSHTHGDGNYAAAAHSHGAGNFAVGSHTHSDGNYAAASHSHGSGNFVTSNTGAHTHIPQWRNASNTEGNIDYQLPLDNNGNGNLVDGRVSTTSAGAHSHNISGNSGSSAPNVTGNSGATTPTFAGNSGNATADVTGASGATTPTFAGSSGATGSGTAFSVHNPYYALAYIMKT